MSRYTKFFIFLVLIVSFGVLLALVSPEEIVRYLGVNNSLLLAFLVSLLGGVSTLTSASFFVVIGGLAVGGVPVGSLMLVCGPALLIGDIVFYFFGKTTHEILPSRVKNKMIKFQDWVENGRDFIVQVGVLIYTGFTPFPGDILLIVLANTKYPLKRVLLPLLLGNMLLVWSIARVALGGASLGATF